MNLKLSRMVEADKACIINEEENQWIRTANLGKCEKEGG